MAEATGRAAPYRRLLAAQLRSQWSYRRSFGIDLASSLSGTVLDVASVLVLFRVATRIGGFTAAEALVMVGFAASAFTVANLLVGNVDRLRRYVRTGLLDTVLVRPLPVLPQLVLSDLSLRLVGGSAVAVTTLAVALVVAPVEWTPARLALALVTPVAGAVFFGAVFVAGASVAFWWIETGELANSVTHGGRELTMYPLTVYGGLFRRVFGYGLGFGFVAYYPALALLDRPDPLGLPAWACWVAPAVALPAVAVAALVWRSGIRHYRSTGS